VCLIATFYVYLEQLFSLQLTAVHNVTFSVSARDVAGEEICVALKTVE